MYNLHSYSSLSFTILVRSVFGSRNAPTIQHQTSGSFKIPAQKLSPQSKPKPDRIFFRPHLIFPRKKEAIIHYKQTALKPIKQHHDLPLRNRRRRRRRNGTFQNPPQRKSDGKKNPQTKAAAAAAPNSLTIFTWKNYLLRLENTESTLGAH
ncbi:AAEL005421-PA [Aedes aegypti]|uniref:AAEL005421-PA n=1 Tax=Aedes aegypti TaxID=7159 RepID=Q17A39_AEDAE|nr:AAEL005421-PA [Aedes aegypti]